MTSTSCDAIWICGSHRDREDYFQGYKVVVPQKSPEEGMPLGAEIAPGYGLDGWRVGVPLGERFSCSPSHPDWLLDAPSLCQKKIKLTTHFKLKIKNT
jgi:hypothetical protein